MATTVNKIFLFTFYCTRKRERERERERERDFNDFERVFACLFVTFH